MTGALIYSLAFLAISIILILAIFKIKGMGKGMRWILAALVGLFMLLPSLVVAIIQLVKLL